MFDFYLKEHRNYLPFELSLKLKTPSSVDSWFILEFFGDGRIKRVGSVYDTALTTNRHGKLFIEDV